MLLGLLIGTSPTLPSLDWLGMETGCEDSSNFLFIGFFFLHVMTLAPIVDGTTDNRYVPTLFVFLGWSYTKCSRPHSEHEASRWN